MWRVDNTPEAQESYLGVAGVHRLLVPLQWYGYPCAEAGGEYACPDQMTSCACADRASARQECMLVNHMLYKPPSILVCILPIALEGFAMLGSPLYSRGPFDAAQPQQPLMPS